MQYEISSKQIEELAKAIEANRKGFPGEESTQQAFCTNWPQVKTSLGLLKGLIALVPGIGVFGGPAITIVEAAGDAAHKAICR